MSIVKTTVIVALGLLCGASSARADATLSAAEIRKLAPATYHVSVADSVSATVTLATGGGIVVDTNKGEHDTGRWSVSGNKVCVVFKHLLGHNKQCSTLTRDGTAIRGNGFTARP